MNTDFFWLNVSTMSMNVCNNLLHANDSAMPFATVTYVKWVFPIRQKNCDITHWTPRTAQNGTRSQNILTKNKNIFTKENQANLRTVMQMYVCVCERTGEWAIFSNEQNRNLWITVIFPQCHDIKHDRNIKKNIQLITNLKRWRGERRVRACYCRCQAGDTKVVSCASTRRWGIVKRCDNKQATNYICKYTREHIYIYIYTGNHLHLFAFVRVHSCLFGSHERSYMQHNANTWHSQPGLVIDAGRKLKRQVRMRMRPRLTVKGS